MVEYVDNGKGSIVEKDKTIADAITFDDGTHKQTLGLIVLKVTNYDEFEYYIPLTFETDDTNFNAGMTADDYKKAAKDALDAFIQSRAEAEATAANISLDDVLAIIAADNSVKNGATGKNGVTTEVARIKADIDARTGTTAAELYNIKQIFWDYQNEGGFLDGGRFGSFADVTTVDWNYVDKYDGTAYAASDFGSPSNAWEKSIKNALLDEINVLVTTVVNAKVTAENAINQLAGSLGVSLTDPAVTEGIANVKSALTEADILAAQRAAMTAIRGNKAPVAQPALEADIAKAVAETAGLSNKILSNITYLPMVQEGATIKVSGTVPADKSYNSSTWGTDVDSFMGSWSAVETLMNAKFGQTNSKAAIIAIKVGDDVQLIAIGNANAAYAKAHPGATYTVTLPNAPGTFAFDLDLSGVNFQ